jgi:hypothetical protein
VGRDAVDAGGASDEGARFADGEVVWFWRPDAGTKLATMLRIAPMTGTKKPGPREEHEGNR